MAAEDDEWQRWHVLVLRSSRPGRKIPADLLANHRWYCDFWNDAVGPIIGSSDWGCVRCCAVIKDLSASSIAAHAKTRKHQWFLLMERNRQQTRDDMQTAFMRGYGALAVEMGLSGQ